MTELQFAYWLNGFAELNAAPPTAEQWQSIREHLATVFHKVTPPLHVMNALRANEQYVNAMSNQRLAQHFTGNAGYQQQNQC